MVIMILMESANNIMALSLYKNVYHTCIIIIYSMSAELNVIQILNCCQSSHALINGDYHAPLPSNMITIKAKAIQTILSLAGVISGSLLSLAKKQGNWHFGTCQWPGGWQ